MTILHTSIRVYPNGDRTYNGVDPEHLQSHIEYNKTMRPGTDLIIDGVVVNKSEIYTGQSRIDFDKRNEEIIKENHVAKKCTVPYN